MEEGVPEQRRRAVDGEARAGGRELARDLGPIAAVVASAALLVGALVMPTTRLAPSMLPEAIRTSPTTAQVGGLVVTRDTGGVIVRRGLATGPVGDDLVELAAAPLAPPAAPARSERASRTGVPAGLLPSPGSVAPAAAGVVTRTAPPSPPAAESDDADDAGGAADEPATVTAASTKHRRPGWRGKGTDHRPDHAAAAPPARAASGRGGPPPSSPAADRGGPPPHAKGKGPRGNR